MSGVARACLLLRQFRLSRMPALADIRAIRIIRRCEISMNRPGRFIQRGIDSMPYRWIHVTEPQSQRWLLKRNCAVTPRQLGLCFLLVSLVSLVIAVAFASVGAWPILPFAGIEVLALGVAFVVHARHAGDYEHIVMARGRLTIERWHGGELDRIDCRPTWVRVEYQGSRRELIRLVVGGREMSVGRFVPDDGRGELARELRASLAGWRG